MLLCTIRPTFNGKQKNHPHRHLFFLNINVTPRTGRPLLLYLALHAHDESLHKRRLQHPLLNAHLLKDAHRSGNVALLLRLVLDKLLQHNRHLELLQHNRHLELQKHNRHLQQLLSGHRSSNVALLRLVLDKSLLHNRHLELLQHLPQEDAHRKHRNGNVALLRLVLDLLQHNRQHNRLLQPLLSGHRSSNFALLRLVLDKQVAAAQPSPPAVTVPFGE